MTSLYFVLITVRYISLGLPNCFRSVSLDGGEVEWGSKGLLSLFANKRNALSPSFYGMLREMLRFNREAPRLLELDDDDPRKVIGKCRVLILAEWLAGVPGDRYVFYTSTR